jgi:hypothetical protein
MKRRTVLGQLRDCSKRTQMKMEELIKLEHEEPVTVNEHYLADYKQQFSALYKTARQVHTRGAHKLQGLVNGDYQNTPVMQNTLTNLRQMGLDSVKNSDLLRLLPVESTDDAIEIMSEVRAYYQGECTSTEGILYLPSC